MPDDPQAQPAPGQDQQDPTSAPPPGAVPPQAAPAAPSPAGDGPWANDLTQLFEDPAVRGQVDGFLRSKVQPYTTQLEQRAAQAGDAMKLWADFQEKPVDTYVALTYELYGPEAGDAVLNQLQQQMGQEQQQEQVPQQTDPRLEAALAYVEQQQNEKYYADEMTRISQAHPELNTDLLHPFVAAAGGDFDQAVELFNGFNEQFAQQYAPPPPAADPAPSVLGSDTNNAPPSTTPVEPRKQSLGEAIEEFVRESRTSPAPPVGAV